MRTPLDCSEGRLKLVIYTKPYDCKGRCTYCFSKEGYPPGFLDNEDTIAARACGWNPALQLENLAARYQLRRHIGHKFQVAVLGGSFTAYSQEYLEGYVKEAYDWINGVKSRSIEEAVKLQSIARDKCIALSVETRPDLIDEKWCEFLISLGVTKVELGVQSLSKAVLKLCKRDYRESQVVQSTKLLQRFGMKVGYHMMVGLPGSTFEEDETTLKTLLWAQDYCPDYLKIYPCIVLKGQNGLNSKLQNDNPGWVPLSFNEYEKLLFSVKPHIPRFVRVSRIQRIVPQELVAHGIDGEVDRDRFNGICRCIYHRTIKKTPDEKISGFDVHYSIVLVSPDEYFIEANIGESLVGYARVRIENGFGTAIIRELRVLGPMVLVGNSGLNGHVVQHVGIGNELVRRCEVLAKSDNAVAMFVNAGVGAKGYFRRLGYVDTGHYLKKTIEFQSVLKTGLIGMDSFAAIAESK